VRPADSDSRPLGALTMLTRSDGAFVARTAGPNLPCPDRVPISKRGLTVARIVMVDRD